MPKRFIDSNLFRKNFVRGLKGSSKLLWIYLFCDCDNAGIWEVDLEIASIYIGFPVSIEDIKKFNGKIYFFDNGKKIFIPEFISFQYGELNDNNPAHKGVIRELTKYQLIDENKKVALEPLQSGFNATKDKDKDKDMDIDMGKEKEKEWKEIFDSFRKKYPGTKRGNDTEFENFKKKHKDWVKILPNLEAVINKQIEVRQNKKEKGEFTPEWKNLQTWINQRCWEEEYSSGKSYYEEVMSW